MKRVRSLGFATNQSARLTRGETRSRQPRFHVRWIVRTGTYLLFGSLHFGAFSVWRSARSQTRGVVPIACRGFFQLSLRLSFRLFGGSVLLLLFLALFVASSTVSGRKKHVPTLRRVVDRFVSHRRRYDPWCFLVLFGSFRTVRRFFKCSLHACLVRGTF